MRATFDTLDYTKGAEEIGIKREHAEYQARQFAKIINENLATKSDLEKVGTSLKNDLLLTENKIDAKISSLEVRMIKWMISIAIGQTALILTVMGFFLTGIKHV
jgi:hypothetical protein